MIVWTTTLYDRLEAAIRDGQRIMVRRNGTEFIVLPQQLRLINRRETIVARHPTTGDAVQFALDELEAFEVVR